MKADDVNGTKFESNWFFVGKLLESKVEKILPAAAEGKFGQFMKNCKV